MIKNPMTGNIIYKRQENTVLTFRIDREDEKLVKQYAQDKYYIIDCSACIVDLLAIPAAVLVVNPLEMNSDDLILFNEMFSDNVEGPIIVLTKPFPIKANFFTLNMMKEILEKDQGTKLGFA